MSNERSNHKPQSELVKGRNKRLKAERHLNRMAVQMDGAPPKVPRGTARNLRRKHLQEAYAKRLAKSEG